MVEKDIENAELSNDSVEFLYFLLPTEMCYYTEDRYVGNNMRSIARRDKYRVIRCDCLSRGP